MHTYTTDKTDLHLRRLWYGLFAAFLLVVVSSGGAEGLEASVENTFVNALSAESARAFLQSYTSKIRLAGSSDDYQSALYTKQMVNLHNSYSLASLLGDSDIILLLQFEELGMDLVEILAFNATLSFPDQRHVEIVEGERYTSAAQFHRCICI